MTDVGVITGKWKHVRGHWQGMSTSGSGRTGPLRFKFRGT